MGHFQPRSQGLLRFQDGLKKERLYPRLLRHCISSLERRLRTSCTPCHLPLRRSPRAFYMEWIGGKLMGKAMKKFK